MVFHFRRASTPSFPYPKTAARRALAARSFRPAAEALEDRCLLSTVHFTIDPLQNVSPISRFIYGVNQSLDGPYANLTFTRLGGNRWTAYNWENNASNAGSDYQFQNDGYLGGGNTPGGAVLPTLQNASDHNAAALITVPINGYVAADKNGGGDVRNSGSNYLQTRFKQELPRKNAPFTLTPDPNGPYVYEDEFVNWVKSNFPAAQTDPNRPIFFSLDNEPDLWDSTHAEVHPDATTYAELVQKSIDYASAIKDVMPATQVFGPVNYGWEGYITLQNAPDANGRDFQAFYLQQMKQAEATYGHRLLDALDVHWYPEATGGGVRITGQDTSPAVVAARLQAPRSLWDPTYTETSWITQWSTGGPIELLPRLQAKINANYPGTKLAVTEYNYGGGADISGGIAEADVLGIFGKGGVFAASEWPLASDESFIAGAFAMYRNFDGNNGTFGDTSVLASTDDVPDSSVYASYDSANPNVMTLVVINKTAQPLPAVLNLAHVAAGATADVYQLTSASATPQYAGRLTVTDPGNFTYTMPAYSVSTLRIVVPSGTDAPPTVARAATASPSPVTGTTTDLSVLGADSGGEANLTYTWATTGTPPAPVTFSANGSNAAKNTGATFTRAGSYTFQVTISDGAGSTTSTVSVTVNQTLTSLVVSPARTTVNVGARRQFTATEKDQFGVTLANPVAVNWLVLHGGGTVTAGGLYTAPGSVGSATVEATAGSLSGTASVTITDPAAVRAPSNLVAKAYSSTQINLAWADNSTNETGFAIEWSSDGHTFTPLATVGENVTGYAATGLSPSKTYFFRVRAVSGSRFSAYSNTAKATTRRSG
jgi:hypothetical protein